VTGYSGALFQGFETLEEAQAYMVKEGVEQYKQEIKEGAGMTTSTRGQKAYYAVANGRHPGVQEYY